MRLCGPTPAQQPECGFERVPTAVTVLSGARLQGQTLGLRLETPLSLAHESQVLDHVLVQHVLPSFPRIDDERNGNCVAQWGAPIRRRLLRWRCSGRGGHSAERRMNERLRGPTVYAVKRGLRPARAMTMFIEPTSFPRLPNTELLSVHVSWDNVK